MTYELGYCRSTVSTYYTTAPTRPPVVSSDQYHVVLVPKALGYQNDAPVSRQLQFQPDQSLLTTSAAQLNRFVPPNAFSTARQLELPAVRNNL